MPLEPAPLAIQPRLKALYPIPAYEYLKGRGGLQIKLQPSGEILMDTLDGGKG
jgi:hypothetical protein